MILERCKWRMFWETNTSVYLWYINVQLTHPSWTDDWLLTSGAAPPASEAVFMFLTFSHINCILVFDAEIQNNQCSGFSMEFWSTNFEFKKVRAPWTSTLGRAHIHLCLAARATRFLDFRNLGITGLEITNYEISVFFIICCMRRRRFFCDFGLKNTVSKGVSHTKW